MIDKSVCSAVITRVSSGPSLLPGISTKLGILELFIERGKSDTRIILLFATITIRSFRSSHWRN